MPIIRPTQSIKSIALLASLVAQTKAFAHDGHGLDGGHWHATDAWGFAIAVLAIACAAWMSRGGK